MMRQEGGGSSAVSTSVDVDVVTVVVVTCFSFVARTALLLETDLFLTIDRGIRTNSVNYYSSVHCLCLVMNFKIEINSLRREVFVRFRWFFDMSLSQTWGVD